MQKITTRSNFIRNEQKKFKDEQISQTLKNYIDEKIETEIQLKMDILDNKIKLLEQEIKERTQVKAQS